MSENSFKNSGKIFITGFMASGKSTLGKLLAVKMNRDFIDLDQYLIKKERRTIADIFKTEGEEYFRLKEREYLTELAQRFLGVIALGGGALQSQEIVDQLKNKGLLIFIDTPLVECLDRVYQSTKRPILFDSEGKIKSRQTLFDELKALYSAREKYYKQAHIIMDSRSYTHSKTMVNDTITKIQNHV